MAENKTEIKTALLLVPMHLTKNKNILRIIHITKNEQGVHYDVADLGNSELRKYFSQIPAQAKQGLYGLTNDGLVKMEDEIKKRHKLQKSGVQLNQFLLPAYARKLHEYFEYFKPFASLVKWYHQVPGITTGNMMTAPCTFNNFKPTLHFDVVKEGEILELKSIININGTDYILESFRRFHFLLESRNEYFLLANKDYQILEWLTQNDALQYKTDAAAFAKNILSKLEENHTVNRNDLFSIKTIDVTPLNRVLLSEISNSFLVLTPQWLYDGYVVEGEYKPTFETVNKGEAVLVNRSKEIETSFKKQLEALHPNFVKQLNGWYYLPFAEAQKKQWFLKVYHQLLDMDIELAGIDMLTHFRYSPHKPVTQMEVLTKGTNTLKVNFSLQFGEEKIPLAELQKMLIAGQRAVMLKDGSLGVLNEAWVNEFATIIKHSKVENKQLNVPQWLAISEQKNAATSNALKITVNDDWWKNWERWQQPDEVLFPIPATIKATLRPYQQKGFEWLKMLSQINAGACLADDMGLGKTLQTICFLVDRLETIKDSIALIVCPSSLIYNWQQEITKFAPHLRTYLHHGAARDISNIACAKMDVCITSYGTMRSDIDQ